MRRKVNCLKSSGVDFEPKLVWGDIHPAKRKCGWGLWITSTGKMAYRFNSDHMGRNRSLLTHKRKFLDNNKRWNIYLNDGGC